MRRARSALLGPRSETHNGAMKNAKRLTASLLALSIVGSANAQVGKAPVTGPGLLGSRGALRLAPAPTLSSALNPLAALPSLPVSVVPTLGAMPAAHVDAIPAPALAAPSAAPAPSIPGAAETVGAPGSALRAASSR